MTNQVNDGGICECGHRTVEHEGLGRCTVPGCTCKVLHPVEKSKAHKHTCVVCGRTYSCSFSGCKAPTVAEDPSANTTPGICNICAKKIKDEFRADSFPYLFGAGDSEVSQLRAKQLANTMLNEGVTVKDLWNHYLCTGRGIVAKSGRWKA